MVRLRCTKTVPVVLLLISAVPLSILISLELSTSTSAYPYRSRGWLRECAKWDDLGRRFLITTYSDGGLAQIRVPPESEGEDAPPFEEEVVLRDADVAGNTSLGLAIDRVRGRVLVVYADPNRFHHGALAAYRVDTWDRIFLTWLALPGDEPSLADDVAVDAEGNAYVTDAISSKIWKVGPDGDLLSTIRSLVFYQRKQWYRKVIGLNGIVYHPNGYLLVVHTLGGDLFKVDVKTQEVSLVNLVGGSLLFGDGMEILSPTKIVVAGSWPSGRVVESIDDWGSGKVVGRYVGLVHRMATAATVKDGKVYLGHLFGAGKHVIVEAVFDGVGG
ncbi:hypothetical protein QJS10_CPA16g01651 [Acorus calamus]|uniref:Calcium-dependent phosphotriesterase superfamily protein n=1 Tax=Acorus calamus TaxID=4465 RepID=A0AAV9D217_ACOCL|nr:hypothetical protein QJS10_CPA16g01651 [Acorus calamus]